jgi:site-specific DNA recombinase
MVETATDIRLIAVYARVSTARQEDENTIETQLFAVREFAAAKGYTVVQEYIDDGWSGDILARPALDLLRQDAKRKLWEGVLFYDPDRLARRYSFQELVMDELRELRIEPLFVTIPPSRNHEDRLLYGVRGVFAEYERTKISERFRLGKVRKANEGHIIATEAPYGYRLFPRHGKPGDLEFVQTHYEVDEAEARVLRSIFAWVAQDRLTIRQVVKRLQLEGIHPRKSRRGVWNTSTLGTLLRNKRPMSVRPITVPRMPSSPNSLGRRRATGGSRRPVAE